MPCPPLFFTIFKRGNEMKKYENAYDDGFYVYTDVDEEPAKAQVYSSKESLFEWLEVVVTAIISVVLIFSFIFRIATIDGDSMFSTLKNGERVVISNFNYTPKHGDIVVISRNADNSIDGSITGKGPIIKRVIATEHQTVDIDPKSGKVFVDGVCLEEDYIIGPTTPKNSVEFPVIVPEGCIFVMGDNRPVSLDSRYLEIGDHGMVDTRYVLGRAVFRIFPFNRIGRLDNK